MAFDMEDSTETQWLEAVAAMGAQTSKVAKRPKVLPSCADSLLFKARRANVAFAAGGPAAKDSSSFYLIVRTLRYIAAGEELLLAYGEQYWQDMVEEAKTGNQYCQRCFARHCCAFDTMVLCSKRGCRGAQHRKCFASAAVWERIQIGDWFCDAHQANSGGMKRSSCTRA